MFAIWLAFIAAVAPPFKMSCSQLQDMAKKPGQCERMFNLAAPCRTFELTELGLRQGRWTALCKGTQLARSLCCGHLSKGMRNEATCDYARCAPQERFYRSLPVSILDCVWSFLFGRCLLLQGG